MVRTVTKKIKSPGAIPPERVQRRGAKKSYPGLSRSFRTPGIHSNQTGLLLPQLVCRGNCGTAGAFQLQLWPEAAVAKL